MDLAATTQAVTAGGLPLAVAGVVLVAAVAHAAWNAIAHGISDKLVAFTLNMTRSRLCAALLVLLTAPPDPRSWPYLLLSVVLHLT